MKDSDWKIYRTRFLVRAKQLTKPLYFVDALGREHHGDKGDYVVESTDGSRRIAPRSIFEDVYVVMNGWEDHWPAPKREWPVIKHRRIPTRRTWVS